MQALRLSADRDWNARLWSARERRFGFGNYFEDGIESRHFEYAAGERIYVHQFEPNAVQVTQSAQLKHQAQAVSINRRDASEIKHDYFCIRLRAYRLAECPCFTANQSPLQAQYRGISQISCMDS